MQSAVPCTSKRTSILFPATIKTIGNTYHVIVPKEYVLKCGWVDGEDVDVTIESTRDADQE